MEQQRPKVRSTNTLWRRVLYCSSDMTIGDGAETTLGLPRRETFPPGNAALLTRCCPETRTEAADGERATLSALTDHSLGFWATQIIEQNFNYGCNLFPIQTWKNRCKWALSEVAQSCPTLYDPMDCSPPGSSVHGIFQERVLEWVAMPSFRESWPRDQTCISWVSCIGRQALPPRKPHKR